LISGSTFDQVLIRRIGSGSVEFYMDLVRFQAGVPGVSTLPNFFRDIIVNGEVITATQPNDNVIFNGSGVAKVGAKEVEFGGGGGGGHTIQDEGTPLTQRTNLNFVGAGVAVTDDAGNDATVVTIGSSGLTAEQEDQLELAYTRSLTQMVW
jgi:hypothetical protein